jgi:hypothetical protein
LNLHKSYIFPLLSNFVGINIRSRPAQLKHTLLKTWPAPETVRDIAKFIGFAQIYSRFIPNFKLRIAPLRSITKQEFTNPIALFWSNAAQASLNDMKNAILADPCILRFDYRKLIVVHKGFCASGSDGSCANQVTIRPPQRQCRTIPLAKGSTS